MARQSFEGYPERAEDLIERVLGWSAVDNENSVQRNCLTKEDQFPWLFNGYLLRIETDPDKPDEKPQLYASDISPTQVTEVRIFDWKHFQREIAAKRLERDPRWHQFDKAMARLNTLVPFWRRVFSWEPEFLPSARDPWLFRYFGAEWMVIGGALYVRGKDGRFVTAGKPRTLSFIVRDWKTFRERQKAGDLFTYKY